MSFAERLDDLTRCAAAPGVEEVLLEPELLARQGRLDRRLVTELAEAARSAGVRAVLCWDTLLPQREFDLVTDELVEWNLTLFDAVRVRDLGAAMWLRQQHPDLPLQLIAETGSHNFESLLGLCEAFAPALERLTLSSELTEGETGEFCRRLPVPCEVLGAGRILLFYSPRPLLSANFEPEEDDGWIEVLSESEESGSRPFPTLETAHGTMMFYNRDLFQLDRLDGLRDAGLHSVRIDMRHLGTDETVTEGLVELCAAMASGAEDLAELWPNRAIAPFFKANKTTAQFKRLKSPLHQKRDERCLAQVMAGQRDRFLAYLVLRDFDVTEVGEVVLPTGDAVPVSGISFRDLEGQPVTRCEAGQVVTSGWLRRVCAASLLIASSG
ncbi:MAG: U32 family peptidase [Planctomycetota bacterium]|nr:U32 family peptidase [Planctomycetota bacterium]